MKRTGFSRILIIAAIVSTTFVLQSCKYCEDFGSCVGCIWTFVVMGENCDTNIVVSDIEPEDPDESFCSCGGSGGITKVTIRAGTNLTPQLQYCFLRIAEPVNWHSAPQSFGPGETTLEFTDVPAVGSDYELITCVTADPGIASLGISDLAPQAIGKYVSVFNTASGRSANIEYDCMVGYDIRGSVNGQGCTDLQLYVEDKYKTVQICPIIEDDELSIQPGVFANEGQLLNYIDTHWWQKFISNVFTPTFELDGCLLATESESFMSDNPKGVTYNFRNLSSGVGRPLGERGGACIVFVQRVRELVLSGQQQDKVTNWTTAHEFGHLLFGLSDQEDFPGDHSGENCLMHDLEIYSNGEVNIMRYMNFCNKCKGIIASHSWEWTSK